MQKELLKKYEALEMELIALEKDKQELRTAILKEMQDNDSKKEDGDFGSFSVGTRRTWTYSDKIDLLTEKVKLAKAKEEKNGTAKAVENTYLIYKIK